MKEFSKKHKTSVINLFSELREGLEKVSPLLKEHNINFDFVKKLRILEEEIRKQEHNTNPEGFLEGVHLSNLLDIQSNLEESKANLISQIENTNDRIWSVDQNLNLKTINSNFKRDFKEVFGINLLQGMNVIQNLPEPHYTLWKERYKKVLLGERYSVEDKFEINGQETYYETSFNPIFLNDTVVGASCFSVDITTRKKAEKELQEGTQELDSIFENVPIILLLIDENLKIININQAAQVNSEKNKREVLGTLSGEVLNCVHALSNTGGCGNGPVCENCLVRRTILTTFSTKQNQHQKEGPLSIMKNGKVEERHFMISTTYFSFGNKERILVSLDDITEKTEADEKIRKLSAAVEQSRATIVITDIQGNIEYANPQFSKTTGYVLDEVLGKNPRILKSDKTSPGEYKKLWETIMNGKTWQGEFLNITKDGREYWENAIISPVFNANHDIMSFIAIKEDITERKRIQEELIRSEQDLRLRNEEKSRFFSILAHDLRGLVGNNHAYSDLLLASFDSYSRNELLENIRVLVNSSKDSLVLLDNLLDWSKATMSEIAIVPKETNLFEQTGKVIEILTDLALKKRIEISNEIDKSFVSVTDVYVFQTIIRNLINNAIKFTHRGGKITVRAVRLAGGEIEISVSDTGIGIDKLNMEKLFKPGEKAVSMGTNEEIGTGLGLMICVEMVKKLGSKFQVESEVGKGSRFFFTLPAAMGKS